MNDDQKLDDLFRRYRAACPDVPAGPNFMPGLWQKIDARHSFGFVFQNLARTAAAAAAALCLLLVLLNLLSLPSARLSPPTYADALAAEHTVEKTYYTEAIWSRPGQNDSARPAHY